jgi:hypothetical protein
VELADLLCVEINRMFERCTGQANGARFGGDIERGALVRKDHIDLVVHGNIQDLDYAN